MALSRLHSRQLILLYFAVWSADLVINVINARRDGWVPIIDIDNHIPFVPFFIYLYSIYFPLVIAPLFLFYRHRAHLLSYVKANLIVFAVSYTIFLTVPTRVQRVSVSGETASGDLTLLYHRLVAPVNLLPSLHVSMLILALLALFRFNRTIAWLAAVPIGLSLISVVFTKQHYILDLLTAVPLAIAAHIVATRMEAHAVYR